jgi:hypothetical protein
MTDETRHGNLQADFEQEDLGAKPILLFLFWLGVALVLLALVVKGGYVLMDHYQQAHQPAMSPLKPEVRTDTAEETKAYLEKFPRPILEENERTELNDFRLNEEEELDSYGWVDEKAGTVHIPIERAMQLVAERGLPVRPQAETAKKP